MKLFSLIRQVALVAFTLCSLAVQAAEPITETDMKKVEQLTGLKGTYSKEENVFKVSKPRDDVKVQVDNASMSPLMGLTSWAAFTPSHDGQFMMMGDTVLFEDEVNPVMSAALDAGLQVTALHNHFFYDQPKVYFMHIGGMGSLDQLASGVKKVYGKIADIRSAGPSPSPSFPGSIGKTNSITATPLEAILGKGQSKDGMFKVTIGRTGTMHGMKVGKEMGINTWAAFAGSDSEAVVDGDFVMTESELQPVLKSMRASGINIVAIHQHMAEEQPRFLFLHYWGKGKALELAQAVKKALSVQAGNPR
jgi:hypothetical protein